MKYLFLLTLGAMAFVTDGAARAEAMLALIIAELTNEARAEGKFICIMPCKEEEDIVNRDRRTRSEPLTLCLARRKRTKSIKMKVF